MRDRPCAPPVLEIRDLAYVWRGPDGRERLLFDGLDVRLEAGEKTVLLGTNGCGKSTLLKLMNGLLPAHRGHIRWRGETISPERLRARELARRFRRDCVLLFQHPEAMLFNPSVAEEIAYGPRLLGLDDIPGRVARWAGALGLTELLAAPPFQLSGGEKQKVALACLFALDPSLLLLDEPTASLDPRSTGWLVDTLLDSPATALISTHNLSLAAELGSRALVLGEAGRLLFDGPLEIALADLELLARAGLAHRHRHRHGNLTHHHLHRHDWDAP